MESIDDISNMAISEPRSGEEFDTSSSIPAEVILDRDKIIELFKKADFHYAKVIKEIQIDEGQNYQYFFVWDNNGLIEKIEVTKSDKDNLIEKKEASSRTMEEIYKKVKKTYPFCESTFITKCNKFKYECLLLKHDNRLKENTKVEIEAHQQRDFNIEHFLLGVPIKKKEHHTKVEIPLIEGIKEFSLQKVRVDGKFKIPEKSSLEKGPSEKVPSEKELLRKELEKDKNIEKYNEKYEDLLQKTAMEKMKMYEGVVYNNIYKIVSSQADYVCGYLRKKSDGTFYLTKWFICPQPFRNLITQLKYPERYNKDFVKTRFKVIGSEQGRTYLNNDRNKYEAFDLDLNDIFSGNRSVVGNTYKKYKLLLKDYENKKDPIVFWKKLQRKMRLEDKDNSNKAKMFGITVDTMLCENYEPEIRNINLFAQMFFRDDFLLFTAKDDLNIKFKDIYRNQRDGSHTNEYCHMIAALMLFLIHGKKIFRCNGVPLKQILYAESYVHAKWDLPDWLIKTLTDDKDRSDGTHKVDWIYYPFE